MIKLSLNDKEVSVESSTTLEQLLINFGYTVGSVAVAVDGGFIPCAELSAIRLNDGQRIDVVSPVQGG